MKFIHLALIVMIAGILLVGLSFAWPEMIKKAVWDDQHARQRSLASADVHRLSHARAHAADHQRQGDKPQKAGSLEEAKRRYQRSNAMLQRAQSYRWGGAVWLKWLGAACSLLGAAGYLALVRSTDS